MSDSYQWDFGSVESGLQFTVVFDGTNFTVTCISGAMDLNALWFSDGDKVVEGTTTLTKSDNSLNLNGTGITWDDYYKVSSTGLGSEGEAKASYLTEGESKTFTLDALQLPPSITSLLSSDPTLLTIGVRATSTSSLSGDGKFVDTSATLLSSSNQAPTLEVVSGGTVIDTAVDDTYPDVTGQLSGNDANGDTVSFGLADSSATPDGADRDAGFNVQKSSAYGTFFLNTTSGDYKFVADDSAVEALKIGQTVDFVVHATDGAADSVAQTLTITLGGVNDTPELSATLTAHTYADTGGKDSFANVTGTLATADRDAAETATYAIDDASVETGSYTVGLNSYSQKLVGSYGTLYLNGSGAYEFVPLDTAIEALEASTSESFTFQVTDGSSATATQALTITLDGAEDKPEVAAVVASYADTAADDSFGETADTLSVTSRDGDTSFAFALAGSSASVVAGYDLQNTSSAYGTLYLNSLTGAYKFLANDGAIEALEAGDTPSVVFAVTATADGATSESQTITINLAGAEDTPEVAAVVVSYADTAANDTFADTLGTLSVASRDGDSSFEFALGGSSATPDGAEKAAGFDLQNTSSAYGTLYLNSLSGAYKFVANDGAIEALEAGDTPSAVFAVTASADGATSESQTITFNITGAEDKPEVAAVVASYADTAADDSFDDTAGTLSVTSRDGDSSFAFALDGGSATPDGAEKTAGYDLQNTSSAYGTLYLNSLSGAYKFVANDGAIEALEAGDTPSAVFAVTASADGATSDSQTITINLAGAEDTPEVAAVVVSYADTAANDTFADTLGTLSVASRDGDTSFEFALGGSSATPDGAEKAAGFDLQNTSSAYGTLYLNSLTGAYKFVANDGAIEALQVGTEPSVVFDVTASADGATSDSQTITINITGANDAARDLALAAVSFANGNGIPGTDTKIGDISVPAGADPDGGGAYSYSLVSAKVGALAATAIATDAASQFSLGLTSGVLSTSATGSLAGGSVYELTIEVSQGTESAKAIYNETFSIVTGTNASTENLPGSGFDFSTGDDIIYGRQNIDIIYAGSGSDTVFGQGGDDEIHGGAGVDVLYGGNNNDTFVFASGDTGITLATADTIADFTTADDVISTSLLPGNVTIANGTGLLTYDAFLAAANAVLTAGAGTNDAYMAWNAAGSGNGWLLIDENDSGIVDVGDSLIVLTGVNLANEFTTADIS